MSDQLVSLCKKTNLREEYLPTDIEWVDNVETLEEFFTWLKNCVSDQNCITPEELKTYKVLSEAGKFEEEEESLNKSHIPENINVYPHARDLLVLEDVYHKNQMRLANYENYFKVIKTNERTVGHSKLNSKIDELIENELRKVNSLISGEYRRSALAVAARCSQLNDNLRNVSEGTNFADLVCLTSMKDFCNLVELLNLFTSNIIKAVQGKAEKRGDVSLLKESHDADDLYSPRFMDLNLKRVFDDCVHLKASCVERQSRIKGISEISQTLDQWGEFATISNCNQVNPVNLDDLYMVCYDQVKAEFLKYEVRFNQDKRIKRERILASLQGLRNIMRPLKLCGDSVFRLIINEYKWIRVAGALLSDCLGGLKEIHHEIEQSYGKIRNIRNVQDLSSATHTASDMSSISLKLFDSRCDVSAMSHNDTVSSVGHTRLDSTFKAMKYFSEDVINLLSCARTIYCHLFNGPSATMPVDTDLISSIIRISRELRTKKDELEKLDCRRFELEIHREGDERHSLMEKFWILYSQDPLQLRKIVEAMEARALLSRNNHLASKESEGDCLEKFLL